MHTRGDSAPVSPRKWSTRMLSPAGVGPPPPNARICFVIEPCASPHCPPARHADRTARRRKEHRMTRYYVDCREMPSETNCDLAMSGSEEHLVEAAAMHAVTAHKHEDTPELREEIRAGMKEEVPGALA